MPSSAPSAPLPGTSPGALEGTRTPNLLTLLCLSRAHGRIHRPGELSVELAGDVALEAAADFRWGLSLGGAPGDVGAGAGAAAHPDQRDGVDGAVQRPVAAAVEPVPDGLAAAGRERAGAAQRGEGGFAAAAAGVGEADDGLRGADWADAEAAGQAGGDVVDDGQQLGPVVLELAPGLAQRERQAADLGLADGLLAAGISGQFGPASAARAVLAQGSAGGPPVSVVAGQQQGPQPAGLRGAGLCHLLPGHQQDPQRLPVTVGPRHRQPAGVQAQRGQHRQVGIDGIGFALPAALFAAGLLALEHQQPGGGQRPRQPDPVAAAALDADRHPRPGRHLGDRGQQPGEPGAVVADPHHRDRLARRIGDHCLVGIAVGAGPDDGVDHLCQHGHAA